jgi:hypothetical protein
MFNMFDLSCVMRGRVRHGSIEFPFGYFVLYAGGSALVPLYVFGQHQFRNCCSGVISLAQSTSLRLTRGRISQDPEKHHEHA